MWATNRWKNSQCNQFRVKCGGKPQTSTLPVVWSDFLHLWSYCFSIASSSVQVTPLNKNPANHIGMSGRTSFHMGHDPCKRWHARDNRTRLWYSSQIYFWSPCMVLYLETLVTEFSFPWYEFKNVDLSLKGIFGPKKAEKFMNSYIA